MEERLRVFLTMTLDRGQESAALTDTRVPVTKVMNPDDFVVVSIAEICSIVMNSKRSRVWKKAAVRLSQQSRYLVEIRNRYFPNKIIHDRYRYTNLFNFDRVRVDTTDGLDTVDTVRRKITAPNYNLVHSGGSHFYRFVKKGKRQRKVITGLN
jgi:hypothetical protein